MLTGVAYAILAARRNRLCWIAGAVARRSPPCWPGCAGLPMQSALQVFFVGMSVYGWWSWTRSAAQGELPVGLWPYPGTSLRRWSLTALSFCSAQLLAAETQAAWPLLDSLTTVVQPARHLARGACETRKLALLDRDRRSAGVPLLRARSAVPGVAQSSCSSVSRPVASSPGAGACSAVGARMIGATLLQHVPGCEDGEAPYSQELIGGGKVNRSFLVRTRRGRFVLRLNENATSDPGLDRARELALHTRGRQRRHRAAGGLRGPRPFLPDHRLPRWPPVDAALLHAHARPAFARATPAGVAGRAAAAGRALRSHGLRATLCRHHHRAATRMRPGASSSCWRTAPRP